MAISSPELTKAAPVPAFIEGRLHATKQAVQAKAEQVKQHLPTGRKTVLDKTGVSELPTALSGRVGQLADTVRHRPVPAAAALFGVLVLLVLRLVLRRNA
ncbi:MAG TPA: hypothetical protein VJ757_06095 [Pseudonocardiaceae bacterium]|nr:hypothetical protein [Pseudonocardiaceae bacterium]